MNYDPRNNYPIPWLKHTTSAPNGSVAPSSRMPPGVMIAPGCPKLLLLCYMQPFADFILEIQTVTPHLD